LRFLRTPTATFARPDVDMGTVPSIVSAVVELLSGRAEGAVAVGKIRETLGTAERAVLAQSAVPRAHMCVIRRSINHCRNSPFP
jgi:hypothetical protein